MKKITVHYVDDLASNLRSIKLALSDGEHKLKDMHFVLETFASDSQYYAEAVSKPLPDIALLDISIGEKRDAGFEMARFVRAHFPLATIIMYSQFDDGDTILKYLGAGADEFLSKETPLDQIGMLISQCHNRILEKRRLATDSHNAITLRETVIVGRAMKCVAEELRRIIQTQIRSVFVLGETGTGKEIVAKTLQSLLDPRLPFVTVNCGALTPSLLESQLFGHAKGAYTGANVAREGLFEVASGGWVFLDEVADLTPAAQVALLRVLENQEITRLGENNARKINVKVLSATNQDLQLKVAEGTFRQDLIERLSAHQITLSPLRERKDEIEFLAAHFLKQIPNSKYRLAKPSLELLLRYDWPTNVRELRNVILDMAAFSSGENILPSSLPKKIIENLQKKAKQEDDGENVKIFSNIENYLNKQIILDIKNNSTLAELEDELFLEFASIAIDALKILSLRHLARALGVSHATIRCRVINIGKTNLAIPANVKLLWDNNHEQ